MGVAVLSHSTFTADNVVFEGNRAKRGNIYGSWFSQVNVINSIFDNNNASRGGAMALLGSTATIAGCKYTNNTAATSGGAISALHSHVTVTNSSFEYNRARAWLVPGFDQRAPLGLGGACLFMDSTVIMGSCTLSNNTALEGGAVYVGASNMTTAHMYDTTLCENTAAMGGAMVAAYPADVGMDNVTFVRNKAGMAGLEGSNRLIELLEDSSLYHGVGGAIVSINASIRMGRSKLEYNTAVLDGGAVYAHYGHFYLTNTNVTDNKALRHGGGLYMGTRSSGDDDAHGMA